MKEQTNGTVIFPSSNSFSIDVSELEWVNDKLVKQNKRKKLRLFPSPRAFLEEFVFQLNELFSTRSETTTKYNELEDFLVLKKLGEGSYGSVYLVQDKEGKKSALKMYGIGKTENFNDFKEGILLDGKGYKRPDHLVESDIFYEYENVYELSGGKEARVLKDIQKDGTTSFFPKIYDSGFTSFDEKMYGYVRMEFVSGVSFERLVEINHKMGWNVSQKTFERFVFLLFGALAELHKRNVFHLDVKPANIMFSGKEVKLVDFGISCEKTRQCDFSETSINPPEYYEGEESFDYQAVDVWCAAYSILCVLTAEESGRCGHPEGNNPWGYPTRKQVLENIVSKKNFISSRYNVPEMFMNALKNKPKERPTARQVEEQVRVLFCE